MVVLLVLVLIVPILHPFALLAVPFNVTLGMVFVLRRVATNLKLFTASLEAGLILAFLMRFSKLIITALMMTMQRTIMGTIMVLGGRQQVASAQQLSRTLWANTNWAGQAYCWLSN